MQLLAIEREIPIPGPAAPPSDLLRQEAASVWYLTQQGIIRDLWFTVPDRRAVILLECRSANEARSQLATLPLVRAGRIEFTLLELRPYDGFERLFGAPVVPGAKARTEEPPEY